LGNGPINHSLKWFIGLNKALFKQIIHKIRKSKKG
jgi:hypothetical protein